MGKFNFRETCERIEAIKGRLNEMAENLESDKTRESFTPAEQSEQKALYRELDILGMKLKANTTTVEVNRREDIAEADKQIRECIASGKRFELKIARDFAGNTSGYSDPASSTLPSPVTMGDIVKPLYAKTILPSIGAPLLTGLKGNYTWPIVEAFEATVNGEAVELGDTKIPVSKLTAKPERIGVAVPITREALNETDNLLQTICTEYLPVAAAALINRIMFSSAKVDNATNLVGPFVNIKAARKKTYATDAPALTDLLSLKSLVLGANIEPEGLCYVMTETTKSLLEATPKWDGASVAVVDDNGKINGVPVFCSSYVKEGDVLFGSFKYAPVGLFGDLNIIVDPYSQSRKNVIDFVLNADYAISVLREEAFAMLSKAGA
jgi:hypothetical protein